MGDVAISLADVARGRERLTSLLDGPTFGLATATVAGELIGFAYGFTIPVDGLTDVRRAG